MLWLLYTAPDALWWVSLVVTIGRVFLSHGGEPLDSLLKTLEHFYPYFTTKSQITNIKIHFMAMKLQKLPTLVIYRKIFIINIVFTDDILPLSRRL